MNAKLPAFFSAHAATDFWCFQEIYNLGKDDSFHESMIKTDGYEPQPHFFSLLEGYLPSHKGKFCQTFKDVYGIATFLKEDAFIIDQGEMLVATGDWERNNDIETKDHHRKLQWMELKVNGNYLLLVNAHLTHRPAGKMDSEKRLKQSKIIVDFLAMFDMPKILVGDFNLLPDTESIKMIERAGMRNLVKEYKVTSTRTELYKKDIPFADFIFVSPEIKVNDFKVLPDIVSDHSPLFLDFDLG